MKTAIFAALFIGIFSSSVHAQQRPQLNAFIEPTTGVLKTVGYVETNAPGDIKMPVPDNFAMKPGEWKWQNGKRWQTLRRSIQAPPSCRS